MLIYFIFLTQKINNLIIEKMDYFDYESLDN